jgi:hypothetical protein
MKTAAIFIYAKTKEPKTSKEYLAEFCVDCLPVALLRISLD